MPPLTVVDNACTSVQGQSVVQQVTYNYTTFSGRTQMFLPSYIPKLKHSALRPKSRKFAFSMPPIWAALTVSFQLEMTPFSSSHAFKGTSASLGEKCPFALVPPPSNCCRIGSFRSNISVGMVMLSLLRSHRYP